MIRWDLETGKILQQFFNKDNLLFTSFVITPDGDRAIANEDYGINLWDLNSGQVIKKLGTHNVYPIRMAVSPDGRIGVSGDVQGEIRVWDLVEGELREQFQGHQGAVTYLSFSEDGQSLYSGGPDKLRIWSLKNGAELRRFEHESPVRGVAYSPDGLSAISVEEEGTLHLWDLETGKDQLRIELPDDGWDAVYTLDGSSALVGFIEGDVIQYDLSTGQEIQRLGGEDGKDGHLDAVTVEVLQDGETVLTGSHAASSDDRHLFLWNLVNGSQLQAYDVPEVFALDVSPDGSRALLAGSYGIIELDLETGEEIRQLDGHENFVWDVDYTPDGKRALTSSWDSTLILWDLRAGRKSINCVVISIRSGLLIFTRVEEKPSPVPVTVR
jgi:WD40 repeat protein